MPSGNLQLPASIPEIQTELESELILQGSQLANTGMGIQSLLVLPLAQVDDTLVIGSRSRRGFTNSEVQNYLTIAEQVALSLENLKLVEQARLTGVIEERQRLAAEIHDSLTQGFISIVTQLEIAEAKLEQHQQYAQDDLKTLINRARQTARDNLTAARQMTWALRPDLQQGIPLAAALEKLAQQWSGEHNIPVMVSFSDEARQLHPDIETTLLRTAKEFLNNIKKHANASQVSVTLTYMDTLVALDVQDDGKGFDGETMPAESDGGGFGLKSIRKQVELLGGELVIESQVGKGTTLAISLPIM